MKYLYLLLCCFLSFKSFAQNQESDQINNTANNAQSIKKDLLPVATKACLVGLLKQTCNKGNNTCEAIINYEYANRTIEYVRKCREAVNKKETQNKILDALFRIIQKDLE